MNFRRIVVLALILVMVLSLSLPAAAQADNVVTVLFPQEPDSLNPMYTSMYFAGITHDLYLAPAWTFDDALNAVPVLVTEMPTVENGGISEDGTVFTLTLRDGLTWSDGAPLTSADFVFTYEMVIADGNIPNTRYPYGVEDGIIESVEAPDATTVVVNFTEPFAPWVAQLFRFVLPEHVLGPVYEAEGTIDNAAWNRAPTVSSGPYVLSQWEIGSFIRFDRNENYFGETPILDAVVLRFVPDSEAYVASLLNEEGELGTFLAFSDLGRMEDAGFEVLFVTSGYNENWLLNVREGLGHPALQDIRVREALALAFNRRQITEDLLEGRTYPAASFWEATPYASPNVEAPPFDPERAAELLDEAGWVVGADGIREKDGESLVLRYITNQRGIRQDTQAVVQQMFADVGIGVELINYPSDIFFNNYALGGPTAIGDYDIAQQSTTSQFPDPNTSIFLCREIPTDESPEGGNYRGYCSEELDALFAEQARTPDTDDRIAIFHEIDEYIASQFIYIGVWHDPDNWVINPRLQGSRLNGVTPFWNVAEWSLQ
jgi:peptide/nickel transport system substrate-binding protein